MAKKKEKTKVELAVEAFEKCGGTNIMGEIIRLDPAQRRAMRKIIKAAKQEGYSLGYVDGQHVMMKKSR